MSTLQILAAHRIATGDHIKYPTESFGEWLTRHGWKQPATPNTI